MNYIGLINQFWRMRRKVKFTAYEADLYFYLLNEANELDWENPFAHPTTLICANLGISRKTFADLRNRLCQKGLIEFTEGQKNKLAATYTLLYVTKTPLQGNILGNIQGNILGNIQGNILGNVLGNHSTKLNETKLNNTITDSNSTDVAAEPENLESGFESDFKAAPEKQKKEKAPPSSAAPPKSGKQLKAKNPKTLFSESAFADVKYVKEFFADSEYAVADLDYYHEQVREWAEKKSEKRDELGWRNTIRTWIRKDFQRGYLRTPETRITVPVRQIGQNTPQQQQQYGSEFERRADLAQRVMAGIEYDENGNRI